MNGKRLLLVLLACAGTLLLSDKGAQAQVSTLQYATGRTMLLLLPDHGSYISTDLQMGVDYTFAFEVYERLYVGGGVGIRRSLSSSMYNSMMLAGKSSADVPALEGERKYSFLGTYATELPSSYKESYLPTVMIPMEAVARYYLKDFSDRRGPFVTGKFGLTLSDFHDRCLAPTLSADFGYETPLASGEGMEWSLELSTMSVHHRYTRYDFDKAEEAENPSGCPLADKAHLHYALKSYKGLTLGIGLTVSYRF